MSNLSDKLTELRALLVELEAPPTREVRIVEIGPHLPLDSQGRFHVRTDELRTIGDYEARFDELLGMGFSWLNMGCFGIREGTLIVSVEPPNRSPSEPSRRTSVNYSGPPFKVMERGWDASEMLVIT